ncbi:MAG: hypothetical protein OEM52_03440 [bacterium]|nr:hypothetical protein [bacterium]
MNIAVITLLGMAVLLLVVSRILRGDRATPKDDFDGTVKSELLRARRLGKQVAFITIEMDTGQNGDLIAKLTNQPNLVRDYDHVNEIEPGRYVIVWPDINPVSDNQTILERARNRFIGISGVRKLKVAMFPRNGEGIPELLAFQDVL